MGTWKNIHWSTPWCQLCRYCWLWWRHQMETFSALLAICAGNSPVSGEFPAQRPATVSFDVFFDLRLNIRLSKQWWGWWFETPSCSLWRHCNALEVNCNFNKLQDQYWRQSCHHNNSPFAVIWYGEMLHWTFLVKYTYRWILQKMTSSYMFAQQH